jgi:hypothetical protein
MVDINALINDAIVKGIRANADRIFDISQNTEGCFVPVKNGILKMSGNMVPLDDGASIVYRADYAAAIEFGTPGEPWSGSQDVRIRSHKRKAYVRKDGTYVNAHNVQAHSKHYENSRLIGFRPKAGKGRSQKKIYRVMSSKGSTEGQFFLSRAVLEGIMFLPTDIEVYLKRLEQL